MNESERKEIALSFFNSLENMMIGLYSRFSSERDYEKIEDYASAVKPIVEKIGGSFVKMTKRPFGFQYKLDIATYHITVNSREYKFFRIA